MKADVMEVVGPALRSGAGAAPTKPAVAVWVGLALCALLAVAQVALGGYQVGVGNQSIQIAFVKAWANPGLFANDEMVRQTMPLYPSYFFRALAPWVRAWGLDPVYLLLQLLTSYLTVAGVYVLGRSIFRSHAAALAGAALVVLGHQTALAGDGLYSAGFTHTYFALPVALFALALAYRRHMVWACVVCGVLFNIHALTAAYAVLMIGAGLLADYPWGAGGGLAQARRWALRASACAALFLVLASPTLLQMAAHRQVFDAEWVKLMRVRSADHSFPSTWWAAGNPDVPRFVLLLALFVLSWSFAPVRWHGFAARTARVTVWMTAAVLGLFAAGYLFSEVWPWPTMIRLQPFRASRLLLALMLIHIAHAAVMAIRAGWSGRAARAAGEFVELTMAARVAEAASGAFILLTLGVPALLPLLPWAVAAGVVAALVSGRLWWGQAVVCAAALLVALLAYLQIQFAVPGLSREWLSADGAPWGHVLAWLPLVLAAVLAAAAGLVRVRALRQAIGGAAALAGILLAAALYAQLADAPQTPSAAALADVADWARTTPENTLFLTPSGMANFRIGAERPIVGDWRDGTQLYFSAAFGPEWLARVKDVEPHLMLSRDDSRLIARGDSLGTLDDGALAALAKKYGASYIVLPKEADKKRALAVAYDNQRYVVYKPEVAVVADAPPPPKGVINPTEWAAMERFMNTTVAENIEKYRKADLTVQIVDAAGLPVQNAAVTLEQTNHAFSFGMSLGFFEPNSIFPGGDEKPLPVTQQELNIVPQIFNASMIPFSGKWVYLEPNPGEKRWSDLDKYVDFCTAHHMTLEFHYLSGITPAWMRRNPDPEKFLEHAEEVVDRYADRIKYWQVENEDSLLQMTPPVFKALRAKHPGIQLGIADCVRFWGATTPGTRDWEQYKGWDSMEWLKSQGVKIDYFGVHGHRPPGLWADPREMYEVLDRFQKEGVRVHITEEYLPPDGYPIVGPVRTGQWTPELRAEYFVRYLTVAFSHPDVDLVNLWGMAPIGWGPSAGMINMKGQPEPAVEALRKLFKETWHTHVEAKTGLDGKIAARAFHGTYDVTVRTADGREVKGTLTVPQKTEASVRLTLAGGKLDGGSAK